MTPPCHACNAACCRQNGHEYAVMLMPEDTGNYETDTFNDDGDDFQAIPYKDGKCISLDGASNQCTIYETRPSLCRTFNCLDGFGKDGTMSFFLQDNENVVQLIEKIGIIKR